MRFRNFHKETGPASIATDRAILGLPAAPVKSYPRFSQTALPAPALSRVPFAEIMTKRRSERTFDQAQSLPVQAFSNILFAGGGLQTTGTDRNDGIPSRHHPSGGALYPIELYAAVFRVDDVEQGLYHYQPVSHALERMPGNAESIWESVKDRAPVEKPAAIAILSGVWERSFAKYGEFAYRLGLMEAGHVAQDMLLASTGEDVRSCPLAAFDDSSVAHALDIEHEDEDVLSLILLGL